VNERRHTIREAVTLEGIGLHLGLACRLTFRPAASGHGIAFRRTDRPDEAPVPASVDRAVQSERRTQLGRNPEGVRYADLLASDAQVRAAREDFPPLPLVVLRHGISFDPGGEPVPRIERLWGELQRENAALSPDGRVVVARRSHHRIAEDEPEVVVSAISEVLDAARADQTSAGSFAGRGGPS